MGIDKSIREMKLKMVREYNPDLVSHQANSSYPSFMQLHELGDVISMSMKRAMAAIKSLLSPSEQPLVTVRSERASVDPISDARWRVNLFISVFNDTPETVVIWDVHTHVYYCTRINFPPPASIFEWRSRIWIEIKEDNSIVTLNRVYEIKPGDFKSFGVSMEVTRLEEVPVDIDGVEPIHEHILMEPFFEENEGTESKGFTLVVFGLFVDYHTRSNGQRAAIRAPSDSVFLFQDLIGELYIYYLRGDPDLRDKLGRFKIPDWAKAFEKTKGASVFLLNSGNYDDSAKRCEGHDYQESLLRLTKRALDKHTATSFTLIGGRSSDPHIKSESDVSESEEIGGVQTARGTRKRAMKAVIAARSHRKMRLVIRDYPFVLGPDFLSFLEEVLEHSPNQRQKVVKEALATLRDLAKEPRQE